MVANISNAVFSLSEQYKHFAWFRYVRGGIVEGKPMLWLHTDAKRRRAVPRVNMWDGIPVKVVNSTLFDERSLFQKAKDGLCTFWTASVMLADAIRVFIENNTTVRVIFE